MKQDSVDWRTGNIVFWDLEFLDTSRPLSEQLDDLKEDLAQVQYPKERVLDIGWYPSFAQDGEFVIRVVHTDDWDQPLFLRSATTTTELMAALPAAVAAALS